MIPDKKRIEIQNCGKMTARPAYFFELADRVVHTGCDLEVSPGQPSRLIGSYIQPSTCKSKLCENCDAVRAAKLIKKYKDIAQQTNYGQLKHVVLTSIPLAGKDGKIPIGPELRSYEEQFRKDVSAFCKLAGFPGGVVTDEYTVRDDGSIYLHSHVVGPFPFRDQYVLSQIWNRIRKDESIVWVTSEKDDNALQYALKGISYALKGHKKDTQAGNRGLIEYYNMADNEEKCRMIEHFYGRRWVRSFGVWYGIGKYKRELYSSEGEPGYLQFGPQLEITGSVEGIFVEVEDVGMKKTLSAAKSDGEIVEVNRLYVDQSRHGKNLVKMSIQKKLEQHEMDVRRRELEDRGWWLLDRTTRSELLDSAITPRSRKRGTILIMTVRDKLIRLAEMYRQASNVAKMVFLEYIWGMDLEYKAFFCDSLGLN